MRGIGINIFPYIKVYTRTLEKKEIDVIKITPRQQHQPYYLSKDLFVSCNGRDKRVSAGSIYTRTGDTNTPTDQTASEQEVIDLWKNRFGLDLSPMERVAIYIKDYKNWICVEHTDSLSCSWHYKLFPEFQIEIEKNSDSSNFNEGWVLFPDKSASRYYVKLKYHNTVLENKYSCTVDGGRYHIICPEWIQVYLDQENKIRFEGKEGLEPSLDPTKSTRFFYKLKDSVDYNLDFILNTEETANSFYNYFSDGGYNKKTYLFESEDEIYDKFKELYANKNNVTI